MLNKTLLTLAAITLATSVYQAPAFAAETSSNVRDHRAAAQVKVRDHRTGTQAKVRDHRAERSNEVVKIKAKDCRVGYEYLRRSGYQHIAMIDCKGAEYAYLAQMDHGLFGAKMNAYSGKMKISFIGKAHSN